MIDFFLEYGLFLAKLSTVAVIFVVVLGFVFSMARRGGSENGLSVENLNKRFDGLADAVGNLCACGFGLFLSGIAESTL